MARFGLIGASYQSQSLNADCQMTLNWYPEVLEGGQGKAAMALYSTPGTKTFYALQGGPVRGQLEINGRYFAISGTNFYEGFANKTMNLIGQVKNDLLPASMVASPQQVLIASGGNLYVYWLQTMINSNGTVIGGVVPPTIPAGTFQQIPNTSFTLTSGLPGNPRMVEFMDGFFIVLLANSQTIYISSLFDASSWPPLQIIIVSVFSDNVNSIVVNQRRLWVLGRKRSTVYYDSGSASIFDVDPSGTIENGAAAIFGTTRLDNSVFWLDQDERGSGVVRRASGYTPMRISTHALEFALQGYPTISDCVAYSYQDQGHAFAVFGFPTAQKTWVYDVATGMWHERGYWNLNTSTFSAHKSQNHAFAFGKHLVGDPTSANVYEMAIPSTLGGGWDFVTDNGNPIKRVRRSPHISTENRWMFFNEVVFDLETGLGPQSYPPPPIIPVPVAPPQQGGIDPPLLDGSGNLRGPQLMLRWSRDFGHTWSNEYMLDCGQAGEYRKRVRRAKLGRARDMVIEISCSDPIGWRIVEGYLDADPGYKPTERLVRMYQKMT